MLESISTLEYGQWPRNRTSMKVCEAHRFPVKNSGWYTPS